jgi:glycosyltransferase involved in cell wall biosynthesis
MPATERSDRALAGAEGAAVVLSANPIHDTGGGQRSAQMALELLERGWGVLFVSHGRVTETVDLGLRYTQAGLVQLPLDLALTGSGPRILSAFLKHSESVVVTQVPVARWLPTLASARSAGAVCVYDVIDRWDSELGYGWYRRRDERRIALASQVLTASAPVLVRDLARATGRSVHLLPNAFNGGLFRTGASLPRPSDLPSGAPIALYVGSLWGGWMDWALVDHLARSLARVTFAFVGDHRGEGPGLPPNCHFLGLKAQADLPAYLEHAAVGILPWKSNAVTQATSPLKVYEYLAMGLAVVGPDLEPLRNVPGVTLCAGHDAFVAAVERCTAEASPREPGPEVTGFAAANSWGRRLDALLEITRAARNAVHAPTLGARIRAHVGW